MYKLLTSYTKDSFNQLSLHLGKLLLWPGSGENLRPPKELWKVEKSLGHLIQIMAFKRKSRLIEAAVQ